MDKTSAFSMISLFGSPVTSRIEVYRTLSHVEEGLYLKGVNFLQVVKMEGELKKKLKTQTTQETEIFQKGPYLQGCVNIPPRLK